MLRERLLSVSQRVEAACHRCGRDPSSVTLVAVTKGVAVEQVREAIALGVRDLGENRVQEARQKQFILGAVFHNPQPTTRNPEPIRWHLIGHLQRNKAKDAVQMFDVVHSVDSVELADELEKQAAARRAGRALEVLLQVNVSGEATKFGCAPDEAPMLAEAVMRCPHLRLRGLMTLAPYADDPEAARPHFRQLRELRDNLREIVNPPTRQPANPPTLLLSMGMSDDFEAAIEEGADLVRLGAALFGPRPEPLRT